MSSLRKALLFIGSADEDSAGNPFRWATPMHGDIENVASYMVYSARGVKTGEVRKVLLIPRAVPGLFDLVSEESQEKVLTELSLDFDSVPWASVVASEASTIDRASAREKAKASRLARRANRQVERAEETERMEQLP